MYEGISVLFLIETLKSNTLQVATTMNIATIRPLDLGETFYMHLKNQPDFYMLGSWWRNLNARVEVYRIYKVCLGFVYFTETKNFFTESIVNKCKN